MSLVIVLVVLAVCTAAQSAAPSPTQWTWDAGSAVINLLSNTTSPGSPSGRGGPVAWNVKTQQALWLFGGNGSGTTGIGLLSDVWVYTTSSKVWNRVRGNDTQVKTSSYGTLGVEAASNQPGARQGAASWIDPDGAGGYMFGGLGYSGGVLGYLNDLWFFNFATLRWTWIGGTQLLGDAGNYPAPSVNDPNTRPRARYFANIAQSGSKVYMFGGAYSTSRTNLLLWSYLNDFFVFDTDNREWSFLGGSPTGSKNGGVFGTRRVPSAASYPGGRESSVMWWRGTKFFMGLGYGYLASGGTGAPEGYLTDMWSFDTDPLVRQWAWEGGSRTVLNARSVFTPNPMELNFTAAIGSREDAVAFALSDGVLIFGGTTGTTGVGWLSDAWLWDYPNDLWIWAGGSQLINARGTFTALGQNGQPGGCAELASFCDANDRCSILMGRGYGGAGSFGNGYLNSVWGTSMPPSVRAAVNFAAIPTTPLSTGAIVGIAIGGAVALAMLIILLIVIIKKCKQKSDIRAATHATPQVPMETYYGQPVAYAPPPPYNPDASPPPYNPNPPYNPDYR